MIKQCSIIDINKAFSTECKKHDADKCVAYKTVNGRDLYIGLFYPDTVPIHSEKNPMMILVHGGSWKTRKVFNDQNEWKGDYLGFLARYYANRGYICASIDYRLMQEVGKKDELIDMYDDCMDAVEHLKIHSEEYGIDATRMVVLGESAGGYLAAAMVTFPYRDTTVFGGAVLVNPVTDFSDNYWKMMIVCDSLHPALMGKTIDEKIVLLSPVKNIRPNICPVLLIHGEKDRVVSKMHSEAFYDAVMDVGGDATLVRLEDTDHAFLLVEYMKEIGKDSLAAGIAVNEIDEWLKRVLEDK